MDYLSCFFLNFDVSELLLCIFIIYIGLEISKQFSSCWEKKNPDSFIMTNLTVFWLYVK